MADNFRKSEFFDGTYKDSFVEFLQLVDEELKIIDFPRLCYRESNPPFRPLVIRNGDPRIKTPNRIAEEIAAVLRDLEQWNKSASGTIIWLYSVDNLKLHNVVLDLEKDDITPRIRVSEGEEKYGSGISWFWTYPFFYDFSDFSS